jgi:hypothetical protein
MTQLKFAQVDKEAILKPTSGMVLLWQQSGICQPGLREPTVAWSGAKAFVRCASGRNPLEQQVSRGTDAAPDEGAAFFFGETLVRNTTKKLITNESAGNPSN